MDLLNRMGRSTARAVLRGRRVVAPVVITVLLTTACSGVQSALEPAGRDAERIAVLFWWMAGGALLVWVAVVALAIYAIRVRPEAHPTRLANGLIIGGGVVVPTVVLLVLLLFGLAELPKLLALPGHDAPVIAVEGEQWWWRVQYLPPEGPPVELANELRLPVGERVQLVMTSRDVIHALWIPSLAGKIDMIPGRVTRIALEPTREGVFRGACAEYCGTSHAFMSFHAVVVGREEYEAWLRHQQSPAGPPADALAARGREVFFANGCAACHTIRGTPADGLLGPDLTHVGSRVSLAAGILPNEPASFARFVERTEDLKPGVHMPAFDMLEEDDLAALAAYLEGLQ